MTSRVRLKPLIVGQDVTCKVQQVKEKLLAMHTLCDIQALEDLIMVSYTGPGNRVFQGVLLDSTKRNIPFGINPVGGFKSKLSEDFHPAKAELEAAATEYPTVCRRQTYYQEGTPPKPPLSLPGGRGGKTFLNQDRLGVRLRARQVLCSKCSSVCNEKGENVKETTRKEKENRVNDKEVDKRNRPEEVRSSGRLQYRNVASTVSSSSQAEPRRPGRPPGSSSKQKIVPNKPSTRPKRELGLPLKPSVENCPDPIVDLDKLQAKATSNCLVPKLKRLRFPEITSVVEEEEDSLENLPESSSSQETSDPTVTSTRVSSSSSAIPTDSMQPLKIRFAHKQSSRNSSRQYSIVKEGDAENCDQEKDSIIDNSETEDCEAEKKNNGYIDTDECENQPLKKVFKKDSSNDVAIGSVCRSNQAAPVLKISIGKESTVLTLPTPSSDSKKEDDPLKPPSLPSPRPTHSASSKAARKALKRAKKEAQRRARFGMVSPARTFLGGRSPGNLANVSPASSPFHLSSPRPISTPSPAYTLLCPTSQKIIIKKVKRKKHKKGRQLSDPDIATSKESLESAKEDNASRARKSFRESRSTPGSIDEPTEFTVPRPSLPVESAMMPDGHILCVGDVVWGRAESNGWWPGKIVNLIMKGDEGRPMAQTQFNKRKTGSYPEAVNLATEDARQASSLPLAGSPHRSPLSNSPVYSTT